MQKVRFIPILFSTPMVQAINEGRKTKTRRVIKKLIDCADQHKAYTEADWKDKPFEPAELGLERGRLYCGYCGNGTSPTNKYEGIKMPYQVGDILWVRETYLKGFETDGETKTPLRYYYAADNDWQHIEWYYEDRDSHITTPRWKPSIFMPKDACRIFLQIESVKAERLQDISEEDAKAEGVSSLFMSEVSGWKRFKDYGAEASGYGDPSVDFPTVSTAQESFKSLWIKINKKESWDSNPFVWIISFKKIEKPDGF